MLQVILEDKKTTNLCKRFTEIFFKSMCFCMQWGKWIGLNKMFNHSFTLLEFMNTTLMLSQKTTLHRS